jgi:aminobenzoyl-glutamate utilization protein B
VVSAAKSPIAHKGLTAGAKVLALSAFDLLTEGESLIKIKEEFAELKLKRPYKTFLPEGAQPPLGLNTERMEKYRREMEKFYSNP